MEFSFCKQTKQFRANPKFHNVNIMNTFQIQPIHNTFEQCLLSANEYLNSLQISLQNYFLQNNTSIEIDELLS